MTDADIPAGDVGVVVVAAGGGARLGAGLPKAFVDLDGRPLLAHALDVVARIPGLRSVAVVVPAGYTSPEHAVYAGGWLPPDAVLVPGGAERSDSVAAGLAVLDEACRLVLVHDAARCLTPPDVFDRVIAALRGGAPGAVPGIPVVDTIKTVDAHEVITGTPDRSSLRAVQTPQGFARDVLVAAYASGERATDDAALVELTGHHVRVVPGDQLAFKVTTAADLEHAARLLRSSVAS